MIQTRARSDEYHATGDTKEYDNSSDPYQEIHRILSEILDRYLVSARFLTRSRRYQEYSEHLVDYVDSISSFVDIDSLYEGLGASFDSNVLSLFHVRLEPVERIPVELVLSVRGYAEPRIEEAPETWLQE